jgi:hypothetical protein
MAGLEATHGAAADAGMIGEIVLGPVEKTTGGAALRGGEGHGPAIAILTNLVK